MLRSGVPPRLRRPSAALACRAMGRPSTNRCPRHWAWALFALSLLAFPGTASAANRIWVSPDGSDSGLGTKAAPFATLSRAQKAVRQSLRLRPNADVGNSWFEPPMQAEMQLSNDFYFLISGGKLVPYSPQGFFDICPYVDQGASYPTNLSFSENTVRPAP